jgi:hypothetical protein
VLFRSGRFRFRNIRAQLWWRFRELLDPDANTGICLPPDRRLRADLCAPLWRPVGNIIQVESREEIVARLGRSPDWGSAYIMAALYMPKERETERRMNGAKSGAGYDPLELMRKRRGMA